MTDRPGRRTQESVAKSMKNDWGGIFSQNPFFYFTLAIFSIWLLVPAGGLLVGNMFSPRPETPVEHHYNPAMGSHIFLVWLGYVSFGVAAGIRFFTIPGGYKNRSETIFPMPAFSYLGILLPRKEWVSVLAKSICLSSIAFTIPELWEKVIQWPWLVGAIQRDTLSPSEGLGIATYAGVVEEAVWLSLFIGVPCAVYASFVQARQKEARPPIIFVCCLIGLSAVSRGSIHTYQGWDRFLPMMAVGVVFGVVFVKYHLVWPPMILHIAWDWVIFSTTWDVVIIFLVIAGGSAIVVGVAHLYHREKSVSTQIADASD